MINTEKARQFFEQLRGKSNPTATDIRNVAAATGDVSEIIPVILSYAAGMGIDAEAELADLTRAQDTARQEAAFQETATGLVEMSGALATAAPDQRRELLDGIRRITASWTRWGKKTGSAHGMNSSGNVPATIRAAILSPPCLAAWVSLRGACHTSGAAPRPAKQRY